MSGQNCPSWGYDYDELVTLAPRIFVRPNPSSHLSLISVEMKHHFPDQVCRNITPPIPLGPAMITQPVRFLESSHCRRVEGTQQQVSLAFAFVLCCIAVCGFSFSWWWFSGLVVLEMVIVPWLGHHKKFQNRKSRRP